MIRSLLLVSGCHAGWDNFEEETFSLLQMRTMSRTMTNVSRVRDSPGDRERQLCPHEMEEIQPGNTAFGCRGRLQAPSTKECSFWGEPHVSRSWPSQFPRGWFDVLYKPGLFRMAAAADGSWEVQFQNCGQFGGAMAARFGKHVVEVVSNPDTRSLDYYLNGEIYSGNFPIEDGALFIDNTHRRIRSNNQGGIVVAGRSGGTGACIDDPGGQIYADVFRDNHGNLNILLEAADGSFTTTATDGFSFCNVELDPGAWKFQNWPVEMVDPADSLFIGAGQKACRWCESQGWPAAGRFRAESEQSCAVRAPKTYDQFNLEQMCEAHSIQLESAQAACVHLQDDPSFFQDCQLDFCASDGDPDAVAGAEAEEHAENPQPVCAIADGDCDPAASCCGALKDEATLDFSSIVTNNLCGDGDGPQELRYGSVLTQQGQTMDLVVTPVDHDCGRAGNDKNGAKSDAIATIGVQAGRTSTLNFAFVQSGTNTPATPTSLMFSFLDIDQGKKNKQRESVEVCGALNAIVSDNSELEQSIEGNCIKYTSTTWGTGQDNPTSPESLSKTQRARVVAYQVAGSSFTATLGVSPKGRNPRKFMFAGRLIRREC